MAENYFLWKDTDYKRNFNVQKGYEDDMRHFLSTIEQDDPSLVEEFFNETIRNENSELFIDDPKMAVLVRGENEDRTKTMMTYNKYLGLIENNELIVAPSGTVYQNPNKKVSILSDYTQGRIGERKVYKKEMKVAQLKNDHVQKDIKDAQQNSCKIDANSLSGAFNSVYTMLFLKTAHSSLTSTCRMSTAYGNGNNEKFITGNRHFWKPELVIAQIASTINMVDLVQVRYVCELYNLNYPTVEQTLECIKYSTSLYWDIPFWDNLFEGYVSKLSNVERAAFVYVGDLYHLTQFNDSFVRQLFNDFITKPSLCYDFDKAQSLVDDDLHSFIAMCEKDMMMGKEYKDLTDDEKAVYSGYVIQLRETLDKYKDLIKTFWASPVAPASAANFPSSERKSVIAGDTDSTIFTVQYWVKWYLGDIKFIREGYAVAGTVVYFAGQMIVHLLAMMSGNMGVITKEIWRIAMKNEFFFPVFVPTMRGKHYFAYQEIREGNVFTEPELELKGAELRNANTPQVIKDAEIKLIKDIMDEVIKYQKVDIKDKLHRIAALEYQIREDIEKGGFKYFRLSQIKNKDAYSVDEPPAFAQYEMWQEVFGDKYGMSEPPPIRTVSFKVAAKNKTEIKNWLEAIEDKQIRDKLAHWMERTGKTQLTELKLPLAILQGTGVPKELVEGASLRKVISVIMSPFYVILEALGFFYTTKPFISLVSDKIERSEIEYLLDS